MRLKKTLAVVAVVTIAASMAAPAAFAKGDKSKGGTKAIGEVTTFDAATGALAVTLLDGTVSLGTVNEDTKVKVEHRGNKGKGKKPSNGDATDLVAGAKVLRLKFEDDGLTVDKIRLRPVAVAPVEEAPAEAPAEGDESTTGEDPVTEPVEEPVTEEPAPDGTGEADGGSTDADSGTAVDCLLTPDALECLAP